MNFVCSTNDSWVIITYIVLLKWACRQAQGACTEVINKRNCFNLSVFEEISYLPKLK